MTTKGEKRREKKARMAAMYRDFFANPRWQKIIRLHKLEWCVDLNPRLVRDVVMGSKVPAESDGVAADGASDVYGLRGRG